MDHSQNVALVPENGTKFSVSLPGVDGPSEILQWTFEGPLTLYQILKYVANMCGVSYTGKTWLE